MEHFEKAAAIRPPGNDGAILRWNICARILMDNPRLVPTSGKFGAFSGPPEPTFLFHKSDFYAHSVQMGLELSY